ncbi:MAG: hypothetical protein IKR18_08715 [Bacteroidaceae bacterium]|nr:hypothetical protein [Bacteroidaceae bacterium]
MRHISKHIALLAVSSLVAACSSINCQLNNTVYTTYGLYYRNNPITVTDTLTVTTLGSDSVLLNKKTDMSSIELPMSYTGETDVIVLSFMEQSNDTIWISHTNYPYYETPECGTAIFHEITNIHHTHNLIDSIEIVKPTVNYDGKENVRIHFK